MDEKGSGAISYKPFRQSLDALEIYLSAPACKWFFSSLDKNGMGVITFEHFEEAMRENVFETLQATAHAAGREARRYLLSPRR